MAEGTREGWRGPSESAGRRNGGDLPVMDSVSGLSLLCRVRGSLCAIPLEHVVETMRPLPVQPLAGAPSFVQGLSIIRGGPVPVVDAASVISGAPTEPERLVTVKVGARRIALAVDAIVGVRAIPTQDLQELPPLLRDAPAAVVSAIGTLDGDLLLVLRSCSLLPADSPGAGG